jgi:capsular exopolysaccharide synthesis family protein
MSSMHDASPRADLEQRTAQEPEAAQSAGRFAAPGSEENLPVKDDAFFASIALHPWRPTLSSLPTLADRGESIEQFRGLRSQIYQFLDQGPLKTILVSSGMPAEGKTFVAANLAMNLARNKSHNILLIDADLRSPSLHNILGAPNVPGLAEYLAGTAEINDILQRNQDPHIVEAGGLRRIPDVTFIPGGMGGDNASELVANHRIEQLIATLSPHFDWILVDSPPVLVFTDAVDIARAADAVLLVARGATTPYTVAQRAQAAFGNSRILGFVLNAVKNVPRNSSYYYNYGNHGKNKPASGLNSQKDKRPQK